MFLYEGRGVRAALEGKRKGDPIFLFNNEIFINVLKEKNPTLNPTQLQQWKDVTVFSQWTRRRLG